MPGAVPQYRTNHDTPCARSRWCEAPWYVLCRSPRGATNASVVLTRGGCLQRDIGPKVAETAPTVALTGALHGGRGGGGGYHRVTGRAVPSFFLFTKDGPRVLVAGFG